MNKFSSKLLAIYLFGLLFCQYSFSQTNNKRITTKQMMKISADYATGRNGKKENPEQAFKWMMKAAEAGNAEAQRHIGVYYSNGFGVPEDKVKSYEWTLKAANNGYPDAQFYMGEYYFYGNEIIGIDKNNNEAVKWYLKAAEKKHAGAANRVGFMFENGLGVPKDLPHAKYWYEKAYTLSPKRYEYDVRRLSDVESSPKAANQNDIDADLLTYYLLVLLMFEEY